MITMADVTSWHMRESAHYNGGDVFFAYLHQCVEQPRLTRFDRYEKKDKSVASTWRVDGDDCADLDDAIGKLNVDPVFTDAELQELSKVTCDFEDIRKIRDLDLNHSLANKGAIEWKAGKCRLTTAGERIKAAKPQPEQPALVQARQSNKDQVKDK